MENKDYLLSKDFKKFKLVYCGELLLFAVIFTVLGVLFLTNIIAIREWKYWVFPIATLLGGIWFIIDLIWMIKSKKRQQKNSFIDKLLPLPCAVVVIGFDIYFLINNAHIGEQAYEHFFRLVIGCVLCYYAVVYDFEGIYHFFKPSKALTFAFEQALEEEAKAAEQELNKETDQDIEQNSKEKE